MIEPEQHQRQGHWFLHSSRRDLDLISFLTSECDHVSFSVHVFVIYAWGKQGYTLKTEPLTSQSEYTSNEPEEIT
jgi:hypothetical protein